MVAGGIPSDRRRPRVLPVAVGCLDRLLRWWFRIDEFTADSDCLIRVAWRQAGEALTLPDGTAIRAGAAVGELHFWNEHLPPFGLAGPSLGWARLMHRRALHSLRLLANQVRREPARQQVVAFYADVPVPRRRSEAAFRRLACRYGFFCPPNHHLAGGVVHAVAESILLWGLVATHNPRALRRRRFLRARRRIWISRTALLERYAGSPAGLECLAAAGA
jgi:hypothetical protein